ncbi:MAG: flippase-like domain-containing protein, partial [Bacteroidales bacterium]|nr:flippase-like domain-containing protein [Bacteroidales bacterium]
MKKKINQIFRIIVFLILSGLLLYLAFRKVELDKIVEALKTAKYSWLILSVTFSIFAFISRARRWILMIRPLGYNPGLK